MVWGGWNLSVRENLREFKIKLYKTNTKKKKGFTVVNFKYDQLFKQMIADCG